MKTLLDRHYSLILAALQFYGNPASWPVDGGLPELFAQTVLKILHPEPAKPAEAPEWYVWETGGEHVGEAHPTAEAAAAAYWSGMLWRGDNPPLYVEVIPAHYVTPDSYADGAGEMVAERIADQISDDCGEWADYLPLSVTDGAGDLEMLLEPVIRAWLTAITGERLPFWIGGDPVRFERPEVKQDE